MEGFSQELMGQVFIFRVGENAVEYGDEWSHACVFYVKDRPFVEHILTFIAWVLRKLFPVGSGEFLGVHSAPMNIAAYRQGQVLAHRLGFKTLHKRMKVDGSYLIQETTGPNGELIMMHKRERKDRHPGRKMPHTDEAVQTNGQLDTAAMEAHVPEVIASFKSGEYTPMNQGVADLGNGLEMYWLLRKKNG